eukprot:TRINITY_DN12693_c0_g1_i1.p1 TRINITY_DN12693_c0_g1~~TRINITY_DN12693_c0_g1_i1.p1  ORF type:complete len:314 (+),score=107.84 TRINITY_DN12693_c0_g1_i1:73-942(+)
MGGKKSLPLSEESLLSKDRHLFLQRSDVLELYRLFHTYSNATQQDEEGDIDNLHDDSPLPDEHVLGYEAVWKGNDPSGRGTKQMTVEQFLSLPPLRTNPFAPRLFRIFHDQQHSHRAPFEIKSIVAFRVYDHNDDGTITREDLKSTIRVLTGSRDLWDEARERRESKAEPSGPNVVRWVGTFPQRWGDNQELKEKCEAGLGTSKNKRKQAEQAEQSKEDVERPQSAEAKARAVEHAAQLFTMEDATVKIAEKAFLSVDVDETDEITEQEFEKVVDKVPDFKIKFSVSFV